MEHAKTFTNLAENLSAKFPDLDKFYLYIHILGFISGFDKPYRFFSHSDIAPIVPSIIFNKDIIKKIEESLPFSIERLSEKEKKDLCKYFLEICLQFERRVENFPDNPTAFLDDLLLSEPQAVSKNNGWHTVDFSALSTKSQKKYVDWDIERYFFYKTPLIPQFLTEKLAALASPKNGQTIYDPNCNIGSIFVEFYKNFPDLDLNFRGVVRNQYEWLLCIVNLYINGLLDDKRVEVEIEALSPFEDVAQKYYEMKSGDTYLRGEFAAISVSVVPFTEESSEDELDSRFFALSYSLRKPKYSYIELALNATRDTGKAIVIVPDSVLYSSEGRFFREAYLSRDWIESVISLPENSFKQEKASIIVFNKNKELKGTVVFDGEENGFERTEVKTDLILSQNNANLRANRYALKESKGTELQQYFDELAETLSEKFPTIKNTVYLYLLIVVVVILDRSPVFQFVDPRSSQLINSRIYREIAEIIFGEYYNKIVGIVFSELESNNLWFEIKAEDTFLDKYGTLRADTPFKARFRELCKYLISRCLNIKNSVQLIDKERIVELAKREPKAIKINSDGSFKSMEPSKLSDIAFQEYSEAVIAQSFYFEKNFLQCFNGLDETLAKIADPKPKQEIFIPNCGIGSTFIALQKRVSNDDLWFTGNVFDDFFHLLCEANLLAHSIRGGAIYGQDFLDDWSLPDDDQKYDIAIGIVPLNLVITGKINKEFFKLSHKRKNTEYSFIELLVNSLNETGKAIVVVPERFLYRWHAKGFKKEYLENDWVESVISLPEDTFKEYGSVKAAIIVFNKNKAEKGFIVFKSEDEQFEETKISLNEVLSLDRLDLRASRYVLKEAKELKNILADTPYPVTRVRDIIQDSISGVNYSPADRIQENSTEDLPYVRVTDLSKSDKNFTLDISKVERKISREKAYERTIIDYSVVLVSKIAPKLKPTYFNFKGQPIVIGSDVIALKMNEEDVIVDYFLSELNSPLVQIQFDMMNSGTTIKRISKEDFLNFQIRLPSLEEQAKQAIEFLKNTQKELVADVAEVEKEVKNTEYDVIRIAIHDFNQKLGAMQNDLSDLKKFFEEKLPNYLNEPIKPVFDEDTEEEINQFRLGNVLQRLINTRNEALAQLAATREELQNNTVKPVHIKNFKRWFEKEVKPLYQNDVNFEIGGEKVEVEIDPNRFKNLVRNLIVNATQHNAKTVVFDVSYSYLEGEKKVRVLYKNDGEPFPEDFDFDVHFKGLYQKSSKSKGTGIGGYSVNKTVELHNGEMKNASPAKNSFDIFPVQIEIILPIEYKPNPSYVKSNPYSLN